MIGPEISLGALNMVMLRRLLYLLADVPNRCPSKVPRMSLLAFGVASLLSRGFTLILSS